VIAGYTVANDLSLRDYARATTPVLPGLAGHEVLHGLQAAGPAVVPAAFVPIR